MGSEVQLERYMPGYCSTRDLGEEASSHAWNYYDRLFHETSADLDSECDKDGLKQKMLEHDAVFRRQVSELHRLYRTQKDLMDEMKRSKLYNHHRPMSLNPLVYQRQDSSKLQSLNFISSNSACTSASILGADQTSPNLSHLKRKAPKKDLLSAINVDDSKDCEIIEYRPGKARKQMFDLQLSADAYIDHNELDQSIDVKARNPVSCNDQSLFSGQSRSASNGNGMKDLNEPIQIEDDPPTLDFMNQKSSVSDLYSKPFSLQTPCKNYSKETSFSSRYGGEYIDPQRQPLTYRENNRVQASHQLNLGQFNTKAPTLSQCIRPESSQQSQLIHGKNGTSYGTSVSSLPYQSKDKFWKDMMVSTPKFSEVGHGPRIIGPNHPSDVKCWPPPLTYWEKQGCNTMKKQTSFISSSVGLGKSSQASNQPSMVFGENLNLSSDYIVAIPRINELDHGSSLGSKEESLCYPYVKFENIGSGKDSAAPKYAKGLSGIDLNCCEEMDMSASVVNDSHHLTAKMEQSKQVSLLPWMKPKPFSSYTTQANLSQTSNKLLNNIERGNVASHCPTESASLDHGPYLMKTITSYTSKQIHGFPLFAQPLAAGCIRLSKGLKSEMTRNQVFDMNLLCETEQNIEETADKKVTGFNNFFDLNSCLTEDDISPHSASSVVRNLRGIDLEAPAPHEIDEDNTFAVTEQTLQKAELEHLAVEAMGLFSSLKSSIIMKASSNDAAETLKWFVGVVSSCPSDSEEQSYEYLPSKFEEPLMRTTSDEADYFEQMTLNLKEMTTEEHMPKNAFPNIPNIEEEPVNVIAGSRPRRGQARRGRPKRDFQRDILPSLSSLSRHEVTEDIQAFDGLMRSSGHPWQFGKRTAARNKPRRGRPRTVNVITQVPEPIPIPIYPPPTQPTEVCIGAGIEDQNLTSWGKTTRRPRRQRCPGGNLQPVQPS